MHLRGGARERIDTAAPSRLPSPWKARWLELTTLIAAAATAAVCLTKVWPSPLELVPLLAVPPALAGIGASTIRRPLAYGALAVVAAVVIDAIVKGGITVTTGAHQLPLAAAGAVAVGDDVQRDGHPVQPTAGQPSTRSSKTSSSPTSARSRKPRSAPSCGRFPSSSAR